MVRFFGSWIRKQTLISFFLKMDNTSKKLILKDTPPNERVPNMVDIQTNKFIGPATTLGRVKKCKFSRGLSILKIMMISKGRGRNIYHTYQLNSVGNDQTKTQKLVRFFASWIKKQRLLISFHLKRSNTSKKQFLEKQPSNERVPYMVDMQNQ